MDPGGPTERVRAYYERAAERYDGWTARFERALLRDERRTLCARARGDVLEVAIGTGRNLPFYPGDVRLTGVDLSPAMLAIARRRAAALGRPLDLRVGDAHALDFDDASFDTVVFTLALSTIPDERRALAEAWRVLRPAGRVLALEHVRSGRWMVRLAQRLADPPFVRWTGDHLLRDPLDHLAGLGFVIEACERSRSGVIEVIEARKPA